MPLRVAIVAGEASGDALAAGLIGSLRRRCPGAEFSGIAGPAMAAAGCATLYPLERLSVMGLTEALGRYLELVPVRRRLARAWTRRRPDVFIGVDAPDFNLGLEERLRRRGIPTVHFVSPSVWAWRGYRIRRIARSVDLMLTLFPFEAEFYRRHRVAVEFVGHPFADAVPERVDAAAARAQLGLPPRGSVVALLPGSRESEVAALGPVLVRTARWVAARRRDVAFAVPLATEATQSRFLAAVREHGAGVRFEVRRDAARECMAAADVVVLASGTASLEALLLKRPMVITYKAHPLTYGVMERMVGGNVRFAGLPNLLADRLLAPELMQDKAAPEWLGPPVLTALEHPEAFAGVREEFARIHRELRRGAAERAAGAIVDLLARAA